MLFFVVILKLFEKHWNCVVHKNLQFCIHRLINKYFFHNMKICKNILGAKVNLWHYIICVRFLSMSNNDSHSIHLDLTPTMPQVWYLDRAYEWHFLAPNFTTYFRMMIYHLGLPQWQLLFTPNGPAPWAKVNKYYMIQIHSKVWI